MPGLSGLFKKPDPASGGRIQNDEDNIKSPARGKSSDGPQRRLSIFRAFLRSGTRSNNAQVSTTASKWQRPPIDPNKPLPPPPPDSEEPSIPVRNVPKQLNRIMTSFTILDLHSLFSGAPQFFCRPEPHGAPWPSVAFPWDTDSSIKNLRDHREIEDQAWGLVTASNHITKDMRKKGDAVHEQLLKGSQRFDPECFEHPNMISCQGLDRGTMGYSAALQIGISDTLFDKQLENPYLDPLLIRRHNFLGNKRNGLRVLDELDIVKKLVNVGNLYQDSLISARNNIDMYQELFTTELWPPAQATEPDDPYCLRVQVESLVSVLTTENIWYDFNLVEWRIRLGEVIWSTVDDTGGGVDLSSEFDELQEPGWQRFWLLLQLLLTSQLLIRLDIAKVYPERYSKLVSHANLLDSLEEKLATSLRWSLTFARRWLDNIQVTLPGSQMARGTTPDTAIDINSSRQELVTGSTTYTGRHQVRQLQGLLHFGRDIEWPRIDRVATKLTSAISSQKIEGEMQLRTDAATPSSIIMQDTPFFADPQRPGLHRELSKQTRIQATLQTSGWLSSSYLNGLVLPGEVLSHLLISTLLENDDTARAELGDKANLYGGFVYSEKSFWSTSCIVGRVLAADKSAKECMGWISTRIVPRGAKNSWVNVDVEIAPQDGLFIVTLTEWLSRPDLQLVDYTADTARIWNDAIVEQDSHVLGTSHIDSSLLLPGDFRIPVAEPPSSSEMIVTFLGLELFVSESQTPSLKSSNEKQRPNISSAQNDKVVHNYLASMRFVLSGFGPASYAFGERELDMELKHDVHFVTAHPCVPNTNVKRLLRPSASSLTRGNSLASETPPVDFTGNPHDRLDGHPLHVSFTYTRLNLRDILVPPPDQNKARGRTNPLMNLHTKSNDVFIIDCVEPPQSLSSISSVPVSRVPTPNIPSRSGTAIPKSPNLSLRSESLVTSPHLQSTEPLETGGILNSDVYQPFRPSTAQSNRKVSPLAENFPSQLPLPKYPSTTHLRPSTAPSHSRSPSPFLKPSSSNASLTSSFRSASGGSQQNSLEHVLGLDRKGKGSELEMLARAWCADRGYNALISRKGRNCIGCSVREARALGWKIVLRFEN